MTYPLRSAALVVAAALVTTTPLAAVAAPAAAPAPQERGDQSQADGSDARPGRSQDRRQAASLEVGPAEAFSKNAFGHSLVIDRRGDATLVWTRSVSHPAVLASHRPAGGDWGDWVVIGRGFDARVEADRRGRVTAVWSTPRDALASARTRLDGSWGPAVRLTPPVERGRAGRLRGLDLAVAPSGRAVVVWSATTGDPGTPRQLFWARRQRGAGWGEPVPVTRPGRPETPQVAVAAKGVTTVMYGVRRLGVARALVARDHVPGQGWTPPTLLGHGGYSSELAVDRAGNAVVAFDPDARRVRAVSRPAGGPWGSPETLTPPRIGVNAFDLAMNRSGDTVVVWIRGNGDVTASRRSATGPWSGPTPVAQSDRSVGMVSVAMGLDADALVAWGSFDITAAHQPAGSAWSEPTTVVADNDLVLEVVEVTTGPDGTSVLVSKKEDTALRARDVRPTP